jgi:hypothetical protein
MPVAFFKCECGREMRNLVPMDHSQQVYNEKTRRWEFDPTKKAVTSLYPNTTLCECGRQVQQSADPRGVRMKFLFNYMES